MLNFIISVICLLVDIRREYMYEKEHQFLSAFATSRHVHLHILLWYVLIRVRV